MVKPIELLSDGEDAWLDRYQLVGELASGGMATVFLARLPGVGGFSRQVAIKRLHPHLAKDADFVEMFLDEARLAARIHHPNVVAISEIGAAESGFYLVMDYIEGTTLARLFTHAATIKAPVPVSVALRIAVDTLSGLHAAHELEGDDGAPLNVVHRDCSPQNILVGMDGASRITDFGIARAASRIADTREGSMKGKLAYMAPEQTQDGEIDRRADLFSVGVVLWEALARRRLFRGASDAETLRRVLVEPIPRVREFAPEVHAALEDVCERALSRDARERFPTAMAMVEAIEDAAREWARDDSIEEPVAVARTVAELMHERFGEQVAEQREQLRKWLNATPSNPSLPMTRPTDRGWLAASLAARSVHDLGFGERPTTPIPPSFARGVDGEDATEHFDWQRRAGVHVAPEVVLRSSAEGAPDVEFAAGVERASSAGDASGVELSLGVERASSENTPGPTSEAASDVELALRPRSRRGAVAGMLAALVTALVAGVYWSRAPDSKADPGSLVRGADDTEATATARAGGQPAAHAANTQSTAVPEAPVSEAPLSATAASAAAVLPNGASASRDVRPTAGEAHGAGAGATGHSAVTPTTGAGPQATSGGLAPNGPAPDAAIPADATPRTDGTARAHAPAQDPAKPPPAADDDLANPYR